MILYKINDNHITISASQAEELMFFSDYYYPGKSSLFQGRLQNGYIKRKYKDLVNDGFSFYSIVEAAYSYFDQSILSSNAEHRDGTHGPIYKVYSEININEFVDTRPLFPVSCLYDVIVTNKDVNKLAKLKMILE